MSREIFNEELDLEVIGYGIDRYGNDLPAETAANLLQGLQAIQQGQPDAVKNLVEQFERNEDLDRLYRRSLRDLRGDYPARERAKGIGGAIEYPAEYEVTLQDLASKIGNLLTRRQAIELDSAKTEILQALDKYRLSIEYLAHTIGRPLSETRTIVESLWKKGYIDTLQSPTIYILFPELRSQKSHQSPPKDNDFLTLTRRGYFSLYPIVQRSRLEGMT